MKPLLCVRPSKLEISSPTQSTTENWTTKSLHFSWILKASTTLLYYHTRLFSGMNIIQ